MTLHSTVQIAARSMPIIQRSGRKPGCLFAIDCRRIVENLLKEGMKVLIDEVAFVYYGAGQQV
ncbi:MAG: hypothetical protein ACRD2L_10200 [Terriglobia bacterium]